MSDDVEARIAELETRLLFQDDTIQSLDEALQGQQKAVLDLQRLVKVLHDQLLSQKHIEPQDSVEQPPPHY